MSSPAAQSRSSPSLHPKASAPHASFQRLDVGSIAASLTDVIVRYPGATVASAFLAGVVIAWWIKRK